MNKIVSNNKMRLVNNINRPRPIINIMIVSKLILVLVIFLMSRNQQQNSFISAEKLTTDSNQTNAVKITTTTIPNSKEELRKTIDLLETRKKDEDQVKLKQQVQKQQLIKSLLKSKLLSQNNRHNQNGSFLHKNHTPKLINNFNQTRSIIISDKINKSKESRSSSAPLPVLSSIASESNRKLVSVDSKTGKVIARMQGKRQINQQEQSYDSNQQQPSKRNEDPWFLDQAPYPLQPYRFVYNVKGKNGQTEQYRQEVGDGKYLSGSYGYVLPDGIYRHVDYVADDRGFRAFIRTSEPGTANQNPSNVVIASSAPTAYLGGGQQVSNNIQYNSFNNQLDYPLIPKPSVTIPIEPELVRRPPGSIINTSLRNFTSYTFTTPSPLLYSIPLSSSNSYNNNGNYFTLNRDYLPPARNNEAPSTSFANTTSERELLPQTKTSPPSTSGFSGTNNDNWFNHSFSSSSSSNSGLNLIQNNPTKTSSSFNMGDSQQTADLSRIKALPHSHHQPLSLISNNAGSRYQSSSSNYPSSGDNNYNNLLGLKPLVVDINNNPSLLPKTTGATPLPSIFSSSSASYSRRPSDLLSAPRSGSNVLLYDRPFSLQTYPDSGLLSAHKLSYDNNHILHPDLPYLSLERARNIAHLDQLNAVGRPGLHYIRPLINQQPLAGNLLNSNSNNDQQQQQHHRHHHYSKSHSESSHQHSEIHRDHQEQDANRVSLSDDSKEQRSGTKSSSGREFELHQHTPSGGTKTIDSSSDYHKLPPPPPLFSHHNQDTTQSALTGGDVKGGGSHFSGRLQAPYSSFGGLNHLKQEQQQQDERSNMNQQQQQQNTDDKSPSSSGEGGEVALPLTSPYPGASSSSSPPPPLPEQQFSTKSHQLTDQHQDFGIKGASGAPSSSNQEQAVTRTIRMPEDYRSSMVMNDLRSMQNMLGLPQPPRLHRSTSAIQLLNEERNHQHATINAGNILSDRMNRVEALLNANQHQHQQSHSNNNNQQQQQQQPGQASSVRQQVAIRATVDLPPSIANINGSEQALLNKNNNNNLQQDKDKNKAKERDRDRDNNQKRALSTGPITRIQDNQFDDNLLGLNIINEISDPSSVNQNVVNDTFDARRLSTTSGQQAMKLQTEKVSELEKFQQRLRTQQLLLEQNQATQVPNLEKKPEQHLKKLFAQQQNPEPKVNNIINIINNKPVSPTTSSSSKQQRNASAGTEVNSHVKYDEEPAEEVAPHPGSLARGPGTSSAADYSRSRRQNEQQLNNGAENNNNSNNVATGHTMEEIRKNELPTVRGTDDSNPTNKNKTSFAQQLQRWPSLQPVVGGASSTSAESSNGTNKLESNNTTGGGNTINLDFINSVTALSMDHLNPFAISSVNPAVQRSTSNDNLNILRMTMNHHQDHKASQSASSSLMPESGTGRLSPHRLVAPLNSETATSSPGVSGSGVAVANARYFNSPELLAALDYHERRDTSSQLKSLLPSSSDDGNLVGGSLIETISNNNNENHKPIGSGHWASNHRYVVGAAASAAAPYMLASGSTNNESKTKLLATTRSSLLASKLRSARLAHVGPAKKMVKEVSQKDPSRTTSGPSPSTSSSSSSSSSSTASATSKNSSVDGFDIKDRALQVDNHRFFEVVSNSPSSSLKHSQDSFLAFRARYNK